MVRGTSGDNLGLSFRFSIKWWHVKCIHWNRLNVCSGISMNPTQHTCLWQNKKIPKLSRNISFFFLSSRKNFLGTQKRVRISRAGLGGSGGCTSAWWSGGCGFDPRRVGNILSWRLIMKHFLVILFLPLIQGGQLSVSGERMCTILVNRL